MAIVIDEIVKVGADGKQEMVSHAERDTATAPSPLRVFWGFQVTEAVRLLPGESVKFVSKAVAV